MSKVFQCDVCRKVMKRRRSPGNNPGITHRVKTKFQRYEELNEGTIFPIWKSYELCSDCSERAWKFIASEKLGIDK